MRAGFVRVLVLVVGLSLIGTATASSVIAGGNKPQPKVSLKEARKVLASYVEQDGEAAATNDKAALTEFATSLGLEIETGMFDLAAAQGEPAFDPYESKLAKAYTVRTTDYPRRFLAFVEDDLGGGTTDKSVNVFVQEAKGEPWKFERALSDPDAGWPKLALDKDGYVRTDVDASKLLFDPAAAPAELAAYHSTALPVAVPANDALFDSSIGTDEYREATAEELESWNEEGYTASNAATPSAHDVLTFRLTDGSALVSFGLSTLVTVSHPDENPDLALEQDAELSRLDPRAGPGLYRGWVATDLEDFTVVVPTKKSGDKATAISVFYGPVAFSGTPVGDPSLYE
jgi:hypothetical protein